MVSSELPARESGITMLLYDGAGSPPVLTAMNALLISGPVCALQGTRKPTANTIAKIFLIRERSTDRNVSTVRDATDSKKYQK